MAPPTWLVAVHDRMLRYQPSRRAGRSRLLPVPSILVVD